VSDSIRDSIEAAIEQHTPEPESAPAVEAAPVEVPAPDAAPSPAPTPGRARDEAGRFAPKAEKTAAAPEGAQKPALAAGAAEGKAAGISPVPAAPPVPEPPKFRAPQSWKPAMRELAAKLPAEFHPLVEESLRIDNEAKRALNDSTEARRMAESVHRTLAPFEGLARANGMDAMSYAGNVLQMAAQLFQGPQPNRPALIAQLIKQAGVNPEDVNPYLSGEKAPPAAPQQPQADPREQVRAILEEERIRQVATEFLESPPEFYETVQGDMHEILRLATAQGRKMTPQQAYDRACKLNEDVQGIIAQRKAAEAAKAQIVSTQRSKAAAVSIRAAPAEHPGKANGKRSLREEIEAAVAAQRT
jgi:hypothetical protein